jgi:predicted metalloprotease with PDZ domain
LQIKFALGAKFAKHKETFVSLLLPLAKAYQEMFGGTKFNAYTIIVNEGKITDGGAFRTSFSQTIQGEITEASKVVWGHGIAHEFCHLWNGLAIAPAEQMEWFKEGATEYLAIAQSAKAGILHEGNLCKKLENTHRKYLIARMMQGSRESIQEAGKEKAKNRMLVYGGGTLVCFVLDVEIREATQQQKGLPDLMRQMYEEFGKTGKPYTLADLQRLVNQTAGKDLSSFFERFVVGKEFLDVAPYLQKLGLEMHTFMEEIYIARQETPTTQHKTFLKNVFGI